MISYGETIRTVCGTLTVKSRMTKPLALGQVTDWFSESWRCFSFTSGSIPPIKPFPSPVRRSPPPSFSPPAFHSPSLLSHQYCFLVFKAISTCFYHPFKKYEYFNFAWKPGEAVTSVNGSTFPRQLQEFALTEEFEDPIGKLLVPTVQI